MSATTTTLNSEPFLEAFDQRTAHLHVMAGDPDQRIQCAHALSLHLARKPNELG
jgi:hypothetical protein